jgi:hypothetical protein
MPDGLLTDPQKAALRKIADSERYSIPRRLSAIDRLACNDSLYVLRQTTKFPNGPMGTRARRETVRLLRKLIKKEFVDSKRVNVPGIEARLMLIQTGIPANRDIWKPESATTEHAVQSPVANDIDLALAAYEAQRRDHELHDEVAKMLQRIKGGTEPVKLEPAPPVTPEPSAEEIREQRERERQVLEEKERERIIALDREIAAVDKQLAEYATEEQ